MKQQLWVVILVALASGVVASGLTAGVQIFIAYRQRTHERERDREGVRRDAYGMYLSFVERLGTRLFELSEIYPDWAKELSEFTDDWRAAEAPLKLVASPAVFDFVDGRPSEVTSAFLDALVAAAPASGGDPASKAWWAAIHKAHREHVRPYLNELVELIRKEFTS